MSQSAGVGGLSDDDGWLVRLPFGLFIGHAAPHTTVVTTREWDRNVQLLHALIPVYTAARDWRSMNGLTWLDRVVARARRIFEEYDVATRARDVA